MSVQVQETVPLFNLEANHAYGTPATPIVWNCFSSIEPQGNKPSTTYSLPHKSRLLRTQLVALPFTREKSGHLWRMCITKWSLRYKSTHLGIVNMKAKLCMDKTNQGMDSNCYGGHYDCDVPDNGRRDDLRSRVLRMEEGMRRNRRLGDVSGPTTCPPISESPVCIRRIATPPSSWEKSNPRVGDTKPVDMSVR